MFGLRPAPFLLGISLEFEESLGESRLKFLLSSFFFSFLSERAGNRVENPSYPVVGRLHLVDVTADR